MDMALSVLKLSTIGISVGVLAAVVILGLFRLGSWVARRMDAYLDGMAMKTDEETTQRALDHAGKHAREPDKDFGAPSMFTTDYIHTMTGRDKRLIEREASGERIGYGVGRYGRVKKTATISTPCSLTTPKGKG